jgi:arginase family enzyme
MTLHKPTLAASTGTAGYHVSMGMDWVDPEDAPGVGTPVRGEATYREAHLAMEILANHGGMLRFELVEVNPSSTNTIAPLNSPYNSSAQPSERKSYRVTTARRIHRS